MNRGARITWRRFTRTRTLRLVSHRCRERLREEVDEHAHLGREPAVRGTNGADSQRARLVLVQEAPEGTRLEIARAEPMGDLRNADPVDDGSSNLLPIVRPEAARRKVGDGSAPPGEEPRPWSCVRREHDAAMALQVAGLRGLAALLQVRGRRDDD